MPPFQQVHEISFFLVVLQSAVSDIVAKWKCMETTTTQALTSAHYCRVNVYICLYNVFLPIQIHCFLSITKESPIKFNLKKIHKNELTWCFIKTFFLLNAPQNGKTHPPPLLCSWLVFHRDLFLKHQQAHIKTSFISSNTSFHSVFFPAHWGKRHVAKHYEEKKKKKHVRRHMWQNGWNGVWIHIKVMGTYRDTETQFI